MNSYTSHRSYDELRQDVAAVGDGRLSCDLGFTPAEQQLRCALETERLTAAALRARIEVLQAKLRRAEADADDGFVWRDVRVEGDEQLAA